MRYIRDRTLVNRNMLFAAFTLLAVIVASGSLSRVLAQGSGDWAIGQAQRAVREQITNREGGRGPNVLFNNDASTESRSNTEVRVRGTGTFSRNSDSRNNNSRNNDLRNNDGQSRNFSYEAIVNNRNRNRNNNSNISGIKYDWSGGWSGSGSGNYGGGGRYGGQTIYLASDDGRRHTYPVNTRGGVRLVNQKSEAACVEGRTWGYTINGIWVDRGCRADFEVGGGAGNNRGGNYGGSYGSVPCGSATRWDETESGYSGVWTRRGGSNVFDAVWIKDRQQVAAVLTMTTQGNRVFVKRTSSSDGYLCEYEGTVAADGVTVTGTVRCPGNPNSFTWQATIDCRGSGVGRSSSNDYSGSNSGGNRPDGRVSYSGPIMNRHSDKSLDVTGQSMQDGANIQQSGYADQPNQNWDVVDLGNGEAAIISRHSGMALTVQGGRDNNGANIIQRSWNNSPQQRWRLERVGGDYYRIVSVDNGKCLDVATQGKQDGANIQLWDYANQGNQQWRLKR